MGESRTELLAWVNDLLQLNYTKVEQAGTGKASEQAQERILGKYMEKLIENYEMQVLPIVKLWILCLVSYGCLTQERRPY